MLLFYLKAIHIVGLVSWFAGLFYLVRLFVYHAEAEQMEEPRRGILTTQYQLMQRRLFNIITGPGMVLTIIFGTWMVLENPYYWDTWLQVKVGLVVLLVVYHFMCRDIILKQRNGTSKWTSGQLRLWNEVATILLVAIVFLAVLKHSTNFLWGVAGLIVFGITLMMGIKLYKNYRERRGQ